MRTRYATIGLLGVLATATACGSQPPVRGQSAGNLREANANGFEARDNRVDLQRDRADFAAIVSIRNDWRTAVQQRDRLGEQSADSRLARWLRRELRDSQRDVREARQESSRSAGETVQSRREARLSGTRDDRRDLRDDRRDLRDDRRDQRAARVDLEQTRAVALELRDMQPLFRNASATEEDYARKGEFLDALARMAAREVRNDRQEIREDRRERREDRRERREDRRK